MKRKAPCPDGGVRRLPHWPRSHALAALMAALAVLTGAPALANVDPTAVNELLRNAALWLAQGRDDKLRVVLEKLLAIDQRQPQALLLLGELELREGRPAQAQRLLDQLQSGSTAQAGPAGTAATQTAAQSAAELQTLLRVYTRDLPRLQQLRLLLRGGNQARAKELARALFPEGRAPGALGREFASLLGGRAQATSVKAPVMPTVVPSGMPSGKAPVTAAATAARAPGRANQATPKRTTSPPDHAALAQAPAPVEPDRYWPMLREAQALLEGGRLHEASERAANAALLQPTELEGVLLRADLATRLGRTADAEAAYRSLLGEPTSARRARPRLIELLMRGGRVDEALAEAQRPDAAAALDTGALRRAAGAQVEAGQPGLALRWLQAGVALRPLDPWLRHDLARLHRTRGEVAQGRQLVLDGVALAPGDPEMRYAAALVLAALGQDEEALATLAGGPATSETPRSEGQRALAERLLSARTQRAAEAAAQQAAAWAETRRALEAAEARRQPTEQVALFTYSRRADDGKSSLRGQELPLLLERPLQLPFFGGGRSGETGTGWLHLDPVRLDAGAVPADLGAASDFGQVLASGAAPATPLPQRASGLNIGAGWRGQTQRWDVGVIGAGFAQPNLVGGWRQTLDLAGLDAAVEVSRRVLTGSLLAYAGTRDPVSGRTWGGVTLNAASLRLGRYGEGWGLSASLLGGLLKGHNVAENSTLQLRLAADRDWYDSTALRVNAGLSLSQWHYRRNLGFYSFGQGGYYSPQRYTSLGLPLQLQGRQGDWSYWLRAVVSRSWTYEADTPFYPRDGALQAAAGSPLHNGGGRGGGTSHSLRAEIEHRLTAHWSAGVTYNADRSAYYAPTQWLFYLRHSAKPQTGAVPLPQPVQPYAQF